MSRGNVAKSAMQAADPAVSSLTPKLASKLALVFFGCFILPHDHTSVSSGSAREEKLVNPGDDRSGKRATEKNPKEWEKSIETIEKSISCI